MGTQSRSAVWGDGRGHQVPVPWRSWHGVMIAGVTAGVVCRLAQYAADRSFWVDEAALLLNVRSHGFSRLFGALDFDQAAPPLFMAVERMLYLALGASEFALRLFPVACGILALLLFAATAHRLLEPPWAALAVGLFALADRFIWHGTEAKQYGCDLLVAVLLTLLALGPGPSASATRRFLTVAVASAAAAWFSYTAMFVFAAAALAFLPRGGGKGAAPVPFLGGCVVATASFVALLVLVIRAQQTRGLTTYWLGEFLDLRHPLAWPLWLARHLHSLCNYPIPGGGPVVLAAMIAGSVWLWRSGRKETLTLLAGPIAIVLGAAAAHRYPFDGARLTGFLCPSVLLLATFGLRWAYEALGNAPAAAAPPLGILTPRRIIALAPVGYLLAAAAIPAAEHLVDPRNRGHLRPVVRHLRQLAQPDDAIYVLNDRRAFLWYWPDPDGHVRWQLDPADRIPAQRFWIVWSFANETGKRQANPALRWAESFARKEDAVYSVGAAAVLLVRDGRPAPPPFKALPPDESAPGHS